MRLYQTFRTVCAAAVLAVPALRGQAPAPPAPPAAPVPVAINHGVSYIGVGIQEIDSDRAKTLKLREEAGVEITRVERDSPADKAGLMESDVVLQYNGQRVEGMEQFSRMVRETPVGRDVKMDIVRNGAPQTVTVKIASRRGSPLVGTGIEGWQLNIPPNFLPDIPRVVMASRSSLLGVEAEALDGQLAQYFGVKEGILVRTVTKGSAAEQAGVKAGDVITRVDDTNVKNPAEMSSRVRGLRGKSVPLVVIRDHKEMTLNVMIADERQSRVVTGRRASRIY
jgi:serine protease Do